METPQKLGRGSTRPPIFLCPSLTQPEISNQERKPGYGGLEVDALMHRHRTDAPASVCSGEPCSPVLFPPSLGPRGIQANPCLQYFFLSSTVSPGCHHLTGGAQGAGQLTSLKEPSQTHVPSTQQLIVKGFQQEGGAMGAAGNELEARCVVCDSALWQRGWGCHLLDSGWDHCLSLQWQTWAKAPLRSKGDF